LILDAAKGSNKAIKILKEPATRKKFEAMLAR
jgi:hypothetical protein